MIVISLEFFRRACSVTKISCLIPLFIHTLFDNRSHITKCWHAYSCIHNSHRLIFKEVYHKIKFLAIWAAAACVCIIVDTNTHLLYVRVV